MVPAMYIHTWRLSFVGLDYYFVVFAFNTDLSQRQRSVMDRNLLMPLPVDDLKRLLTFKFLGLLGILACVSVVQGPL